MRMRLTDRDLKPEGTVVDVRGVEIGGPTVVVMAGPCAVESREQMLATARAVTARGDACSISRATDSHHECATT